MIEWVPVKGWVLSIDKEATIRAYEELSAPWPSCTCLYCQNFTTASHLLPREFVQFCSDAGVNPLKPIEVYELTAGTEQGTRLYGGWYHLVGQIVSSPNAEASSGSGNMFVGGFQVRFTDNPSLVQEGFPGPILQLEFFGDIPWVVNEKPEIW